jgi:succinoglycan biosynthesis protein ExoA
MPQTIAEPPRKVLVVIPCLNESAQIERVINRILEDDRAGDIRLVVADGGSTDGCRGIVRRMAANDDRIQLLPNPKRLQSAGVNLAAAAATDDVRWLVRVDAHAEYPANYVSTLISEAERTEADSVVVTMDTQGSGLFQRAAAAAQNSVLGAGGSPHRSGGSGWVDHGHHALFRLDAFQRVGGYDEAFSHNEDAELDHRLAGAGARIWLTDRPHVVYHPRRDPVALWKQYLNYGRGRARTVLKHHTRLKLRQMAPLAVAPAVLLAAFAPLHALFAVPALVWLVACLAGGLALGAKQRSVAAMGSGIAAAIMHLAWSLGFWRQLFGLAPAAKAA